MGMPAMHTIAKNIGISGAAAVTFALVTPVLPGLAGTAYACGDGAGASVKAGSSEKAKQADLDKVTVALSGVPAKVTRGTPFVARLTVTNTSAVALARFPVGVGLSLLDHTQDSPDGKLHNGTPKDATVIYAVSDQSAGELALRTGCDPSMGGTITVPGPVRAGGSTTIVLTVTVKASTPVQVVDGSLSASGPRARSTAYKAFTLAKSAPPKPTSPKPTATKPTSPKPTPTPTPTKKTETTPAAPVASTSPRTTQSTPPAPATTAEPPPAALPKTGSPSHVPAFAAVAGGLVLLGTTSVVLARRRR